MTENSTLWVARDVTDHKSAEDALLDASEILVRNLTELEQRTLEISLLNKMVASFQASLTTEEVYAIAEQACAQLFPEEAGTLFRLNPSQDISEPCGCLGIFFSPKHPDCILTERLPGSAERSGTFG